MRYRRDRFLEARRLYLFSDIKNPAILPILMVFQPSKEFDLRIGLQDG